MIKIKTQPQKLLGLTSYMRNGSPVFAFIPFDVVKTKIIIDSILQSKRFVKYLIPG